MPPLQTLDQAMLHTATALPILGRIGGGQIALVDGRQPWRTVGMDNSVYVLRQPAGRMLALRIPLADAVPPALAAHYTALANDQRLLPLKNAPGSPIPARAAWYADGLALPARDLRSIRHPLAVLDWIDGPTLIAAVDRSCRAGDGAALAALANAWTQMVGLLTVHGFVHGDLAADNVIVRADGTLALIDFDTAIWPGSPPALPARPNLAYSHPGGQQHSDPARRDDFAALLVYVSLRVLAERPDLRSQFGDPTSEPGGALLWKHWDLTHPQKSPVFAATDNLSPDVGRLVNVLRQAVAGPVERSPRLSDLDAPIFQSSRGPEPGAPLPDPPGRVAPPRPPVPQRPPMTPQQPPRPPEPPPPPVQHARTVAPATGRPSGSAAAARGLQGLLTQLNGFLLSGDDARTLAFWRESGLSQDPGVVREYAAKIREVEHRQSAALIQAAAEKRDSLGVLRHWQSTGLDGTPVGRTIYPVVEHARLRVAQAERLRSALTAGDRDRVAALWQELRGDPLVAMETARVAALLGNSIVEQLNQALARQDDREILDAVADAEAAAIPIGPDARQARRAAYRREATRTTLAASHRDMDDSALADLALSGRLDELGRLDPATSRSAQRAMHRPILANALEGDDDWVIATVFEANASLYDEGDLSPDERERIELAQSRLAWLADVRSALRTRDLEVLKTLTQSAPKGAVARLSDVERARIERLSRRDVAVRRLERLLREGTDREILSALAAMKETGADFPQGFDWATLRAVEERTELSEGIMAALAASPPDLDRLSILLPAAKAAVEAGNPPQFSGTTLEQIEHNTLLAARVARIREAIVADDVDAIRAIAVPDTESLLEMLNDEERSRVQQVISRNAVGT